MLLKFSVLVWILGSIIGSLSHAVPQHPGGSQGHPQLHQRVYFQRCHSAIGNVPPAERYFPALLLNAAMSAAWYIWKFIDFGLDKRATIDIFPRTRGVVNVEMTFIRSSRATLRQYVCWPQNLVAKNKIDTIYSAWRHGPSNSHTQPGLKLYAFLWNISTENRLNFRPDWSSDFEKEILNSDLDE